MTQDREELALCQMVASQASPSAVGAAGDPCSTRGDAEPGRPLNAGPLWSYIVHHRAAHRHRHPATPRLVPAPQRLHTSDLRGEPIVQRGGQHDATVPVALAGADDDLRATEVNISDPQRAALA